MNPVIILGTRPEIIKCASIIKVLDNPIVVHTGQHYADKMSDVFFKDLELSKPAINLKIGSHMRNIQIAKMVRALETTLRGLEPDVVIVQGDTNSALAGAMSAHSLKIPVVHIEAGLRSNDMTMPEEVNRIIIDIISSVLCAPTQVAADNLTSQGLKSVVTGNTSIDTLVKYMGKAKAPPKFGKEKVLITLHRPFNVDNAVKFESIIGKISLAIKDLEAVIPIHPRIQHKFTWPKNIKPIEPLGYLEFIYAMKQAPVIITDSGGIQEEACYLRVPCVTLRPNTERPETIAIGANVLSKKEDLVDNIEKMLFCNRKWACPYGDGTAYKKILSKIQLLLKDK